ncbi:MAG TPA: aldehyde dehydrogenase family protein, partial [Polyangiales bacterium]|nr:aldehyde dehydrogenase family protein [Polyangiales bacterium]
MEIAALCENLGVDAELLAGGDLRARSPIDGAQLGMLRSSSAADVDQAIERAHAAFLALRSWPAPKRGELIRLFG